MKRIILELECIKENALLPYNYQTAIRAYIYNRIGTGDEQFAEDLHKSNSYKFFTFSFLDFLPDTYRTTRQGINLLAGKGSLVVSFYQEEAATAFIQGIEETPIMELLGVEFDIVNAEFLDNPTFGTQSKCSCLSPLFISYATDNNVKFYHPKERNAANLLHSDIYVDLIQEFYDKYELPALHHDGDGFSQGDVSDEEFDAIFDRIKEVHSTDFSNEISSMSREEVSNEEILEFLDKEFMSIEETAYDAVLEKYEDDSFQERNEIFSLEVKGNSFNISFEEDIYETELSHISVKDEDELVYEAEQYLLDMQRYGEAPYSNIEFEFIEVEGNRVICRVKEEALAGAIFSDKLLGKVEHSDEPITFEQFASYEWTGYHHKKEFATLQGEGWKIEIEEQSIEDYAEEKELSVEEVNEREQDNSDAYFARMKAILFIEDEESDIEVPMF